MRFAILASNLSLFRNRVKEIAIREIKVRIEVSEFAVAMPFPTMLSTMKPGNLPRNAKSISVRILIFVRLVH